MVMVMTDDEGWMREGVNCGWKWITLTVIIESLW